MGVGGGTLIALVLAASPLRGQAPCAVDSGVRRASPPLVLFASIPRDSVESDAMRRARGTVLQEYVARFTRPADITLVQAKAEALMRRGGGAYEPGAAPLAAIEFTVTADGRYADARRTISTGDPRFDSALLEPVARLDAERGPSLPPGGHDTLRMRIALGLDPDGGLYTMPIAQLAPLSTITKAARLIPTDIYPQWPKSMEAKRINDDVVVRILVDAHGRAVPDSVRVVMGKHKEYIEAVLAVIPRYKWMPAESDGCTVRQWVQMPFMFHFAPTR